MGSPVLPLHCTYSMCLLHAAFSFIFFSLPSWNEIFSIFVWRRTRLGDVSSLMGHWFLLTRVSPYSEFDWKMREKNKRNKREKTQRFIGRARGRIKRGKRKKDEDGLAFFPLFGYWLTFFFSFGRQNVFHYTPILFLFFSSFNYFLALTRG